MTAIDVSCDWACRDDSAITAKFLPPPLPRIWVHRDRLDRQLSIALQHRLTVVTGPPGAGKTGLLVDWAQRRPNGLVAWLNVEAADNDPKLFRDSVAAAMGTDHAQHGASVRQQISKGRRSRARTSGGSHPLGPAEGPGRRRLSPH